MTANPYPPIGSVSTDTLRPRDLIPAFLSILETYAPESAQAIERRSDYGPLMYYYAGDDYDAVDPVTLEHGSPEYHNPEQPDQSAEDAEEYILEHLYSELEEIAPPYCRFGAHEGDGADIGYWPMFDVLSDDADAGEVAIEDGAGRLRTVEDYGKPPTRELPQYATRTNDHGNVTLYRVTYTLTEIWSVV